jgi:hypothetical protein
MSQNSKNIGFLHIEVSFFKVDEYLKLLAIPPFAYTDRETHRKHSQAREKKARNSEYE